MTDPQIMPIQGAKLKMESREEIEKIRDQILRNRTFLIGLAGRARSGKDFTATTLATELPSSRIYSLALALKAYCRVAGLMTWKDPKLLQVFGTDIFRAHEPNIWIRILGYQIVEESPHYAIISDCRFPNEVEFCKRAGVVIHMVRLNDDGSEWISQDRPAGHPSESSLNEEARYDYEIRMQSGNIEGLRDAGIAIAERLAEARSLYYR